MPPRTAPSADLLASAGGATGSVSVPSTCVIVVCCTFTGIAATTRCVIFTASLARGPACSAALTSHARLAEESTPSISGVVTAHATSCDDSGTSSTRARVERERSRTRCDDDPHRPQRRVAQGELHAEHIADAHERRQSRDELQILRALDGRAAGAEPPRANRRDRDNPEARERVVPRHIDGGFALCIERHPQVPQQQRVEQLARRAVSATAAGGHGLAPEVTPPADFHLRRRRLDAIRALLEHRVKHVPASIRHEFEQRFIDGRAGDLRARGRRLAVGQSDFYLHMRVAPRRVGLGVRAHAHREPVRRRADLDRSESVTEGRLDRSTSGAGARY